MAPLPGDAIFYGFGSNFQFWNDAIGARICRVIRASSNRRVDVLEINVSWNTTAPPGDTRVANSQIAVWRANSQYTGPIPDSFSTGTALAAGIATPSGLELLYAGVITGQHFFNTVVGSPFPWDMSNNNLTFPPGTLYARQGQEIWIQVNQPFAGFGAPSPLYNPGTNQGVTEWLSVFGIDYGALDPSDSEQSQYRSLPRYSE